MTDYPAAEVMRIVKGFQAMAADLAVAGGILRCSSCGTERLLGDTAAHVARGWPKCCNLTMTWVTLKLLAAEIWEVPEDCELVAVENESWRLENSKTCSRRVSVWACGAPSVASLNRPRHPRATSTRPARTVDSWWPQCLDHLYGNWIEDGQVMHWIMREKINNG